MSNLTWKNSTMGSFCQNKDKHGWPKYTMVHYNFKYMLTQPKIPHDDDDDCNIPEFLNVNFEKMG